MREQIFNYLLGESTLPTDFYIKQQINKLTLEDILTIKNFLSIYKDLSDSDFDIKINRAFLDNPSKPKNWKIITEIYQVISTRSKRSLA